MDRSLYIVVTDPRSTEMRDVDRVLDGDLSLFIQAYLLWRRGAKVG